MTPTITVIICTAGKPESLRQTLGSLADVRVPGSEPGELLIVDNRPNTAEDVANDVSMSNFNVRYLAEPRPGQTMARNTGIASSRGEIIVFTDDDIRFQADWLENLIGPISRGEADATVGTITIAPELERPWMKSIHRAFYAEMSEDHYGPLRLIGANMAFGRKVLKDVPGFDEKLGPGQLGFSDDTLFSAQLSAAGYTVQFVPTAGVTHHFDSSRLKRSHLIGHAAQIGKSQAYVAYHWEHRTIFGSRLHDLRKRMHLYVWRLLRRSEVSQDEGCAEAEIYTIIAQSFYEYFGELTKQPRKYDRSFAQLAPNGIVGQLKFLVSNLRKGS